jgi:hypothetical protein
VESALDRVVGGVDRRGRRRGGTFGSAVRRIRLRVHLRRRRRGRCGPRHLVVRTGVCTRGLRWRRGIAPTAGIGRHRAFPARIIARRNRLGVVDLPAEVVETLVDGIVFGV